MPHRIQRQRTKGWRMPPNTVYVGRPTRFGNPYRVVKCITNAWSPMGGYNVILDDENGPVNVAWFKFKDSATGFVIKSYSEQAEFCSESIRRDLRGKNLACWCRLKDERGNHVPCHADVLLEIAND